MTSRSIALPLALVGLGFAIGYIWNHTRESAPDLPITAISTPAVQHPTWEPVASATSNEERDDPFVLEVRRAPLSRLAQMIEAHADDASAYRLIAKRWAAEDPLGFFAYIESIRLRGERHSLRSGLETILYRVWGRNDPERAFQHALSHPWWNGRYRGLGTIVNVVAETNIDRALSMVEEAGRRLSSYGPGPWTDIEPETILPKVLALSENHSWRSSALNDIFENWAKREPKEALTYYVNKDLDLTSHTGVSLAKSVIRQDPEGARRWAQNQEAPNRDALVAIFESVMRNDARGRDVEGHSAPVVIGPFEEALRE